MTVVILIKRVARADRVEEFRKKYIAERPNHVGFIAEFLTEVNRHVDARLRSLMISASEGVTFVNVAFWRSEEDFISHFNPTVGYYDPEIEWEPRTRLVLSVQGAAGQEANLVNLVNNFSVQ